MKMTCRIVIGLFLVLGVSLASDLFVKEAEAHCTWKHMRHCFHGSDRPKNRDAALNGVTRDIATLNPISGVMVNAYRKANSKDNLARSGESGKYEFTGLSSGAYDLKAARFDSDGTFFTAGYVGKVCNVTLSGGVNVVDIPMFGGKLKPNRDC